jgi:acyl dehydratase
MNILRASVVALLSLSSAAHADEIREIALATNDIILDPVSKRIFASVPSSAGGTGNSVVSIQPDTGALGAAIFVGSEPGKLAISDNGQYLYVALDGAAAVRRFDIPSQTAGLQFALGSDAFFGPYYAEDIAVLPGNPTAIAVSRKNLGVSPRHAGVAIYDNGVKRPTETPRYGLGRPRGPAPPLMALRAPLYFEDFKPGDRFESAPLTVSEPLIVEFARYYDAQVFHLDPDAAKASVYGGLIASGLQTIALTFKLFLETGAIATCSLGSPGLDEVRWMAPVRPGDILRVVAEILQTRPSTSKPDRGIVRILYTTLNQRDETVLTLIGNQLCRRRSEGAPA